MSKHLLDPSVAASPQPPAPVWADPARAGAFHEWLAREAPMHGLVPDTVRVASADASFRRYLRIDSAAGDVMFLPSGRVQAERAVASSWTRHPRRKTARLSCTWAG